MRTVTTTPTTRGPQVKRRNRSPIARLRAAVLGIRRFLRQVVSELRKVVRPTRNELVTYTIAVLIFVVAVMAYVSGLDFLLGRLVLWAFGGGS